MSEERVVCPFSGHDGQTVNVRFFRGTRNDVILAEEIEAQVRHAVLQQKTGTALVSREAPRSPNRVVNVNELVASL